MAGGWLCWLACAAVVLGCDRADETSVSGTACAAGEWLRDDGLCVAPGLPPEMPCEPGEWLSDTDGACISAGVPPDGCAEGFEHDGDRGCEAILPAEPCAPGSLAVPGERNCHEVSSCGTDKWGEIPVEPTTQYVDGDFVGVSDGSQAAPWTTIQAGVNAAAPGAIVAIAAGSYADDVLVHDKSVRLWGRCPSLVELRGSGLDIAALFVLQGATDTQIRGIAVRTSSIGILVNGAQNVVVEEAWIHDNESRGINAQDEIAPTSVVLRRSLLERNTEVGLFLGGSQATIDASVVRDTAGRGISAQLPPTTLSRAPLAIRNSVFERNVDFGVYVAGLEATIDATVVRDTTPAPDAARGTGIGVEYVEEHGARASLEMRGSVLDRNVGSSLSIVSSDATVGATLVRDTLPYTNPELASSGIVATDAMTGVPAKLRLERSLSERNTGFGVIINGSDATMFGIAARHTLRGADYGVGVGLHHSSTTIESSLFEGNDTVGMFVVGSDVTVDKTASIDTTSPDVASSGVAVQASEETGRPSSARFRHGLIEHNQSMGLSLFGPSTLLLEESVVRASFAHEGVYGDGLIVASTDGLARADVRGLLMENTERAAVANHGGHVSLEGSSLVCQAIDLASADYRGQPSVFEDLGDVSCGCPMASGQCRALRTELEPPTPLE